MSFTTQVILWFLALGSHTAAYPTLAHLEQLVGGDLKNPTATFGSVNVKEARATFNYAEQLVDVHGTHEFVAPNLANDIRGPCPGLNALSNHGYLPHNGVASLLQYTQAVKEVYNMGDDLGGALSVFGTAVAGNLVSLNPGYSMGGKTKNSQNLLGSALGLLAEPVGLSGTHGQYEEDSSATRGDLYLDGDNEKMMMPKFMALYNLQADADEPNYSMDVILEHSKARYYESLKTNPYFWYGPIGGTIVRNAAYAFIGRLFANYSEEYPVDGRLSKETLKSFYGVSGAEGSFTYLEGGERIPENFYKRQTPYGFAEFSVDLAAWSAKFPTLLNAGGNTGKVNSFVGIDVENLSGGVFNSANLLESNNAVCLGLELLIEFSPGLLHSVYTTITSPLKKLTDSLGPTITSLNCPQLETAQNGGKDILQDWAKTYPGVAKAKVAI